jgi:hypothetical protein
MALRRRRHAPIAAAAQSGGSHEEIRPKRIGFIGCVKQKGMRPMAAADLYESTLFRGRRAYVEASCDSWWILSAEHGLVHPANVLEPYDKTLKDASRDERRAWTREVLRAGRRRGRSGRSGR